MNTSKQITDAFRRQIKRRRDKRGWTQEHVARRMGCSRAFISQYELGHRSPGLEVLWAFSKALQCKPADLIR